MKAKRIRVPEKTRAKLQKEIDSKCPFCENQDVGCFEVHHIHGDPMNNNFINLILVCPTCHTKIEKNEISIDMVLDKKMNLKEGLNKVILSKVVIDNSKCGWEVSGDNDYAFFKRENGNTERTILKFNFINNSSKTVILHTIEVLVKRLYSGLSGIGPDPKVLFPLATYQIPLSYFKDINILELNNPIGVGSGQPFQIEIELFNGESINESTPIGGRMITYFKFKLSEGVLIKAKPIYFNCKSENEPMEILLLT